MAWITAVTDWDSEDYYNYDDINRVENNTQYVYDELLSLGYSPTLGSVVTTWAKTDIPFYDDLIRIESNIKALADASFEPPLWVSPVIDWVSVYDVFDYNDAYRLESNLVNLKSMVENIEIAYLYNGDALTTICGKGNTLF